MKLLFNINYINIYNIHISCDNRSDHHQLSHSNRNTFKIQLTELNKQHCIYIYLLYTYTYLYHIHKRTLNLNLYIHSIFCTFMYILLCIYFHIQECPRLQQTFIPFVLQLYTYIHHFHISIYITYSHSYQQKYIHIHIYIYKRKIV